MLETAQVLVELVVGLPDDRAHRRSGSFLVGPEGLQGGDRFQHGVPGWRVIGERVVHQCVAKPPHDVEADIVILLQSHGLQLTLLDQDAADDGSQRGVGGETCEPPCDCIGRGSAERFTRKRQCLVELKVAELDLGVRRRKQAVACHLLLENPQPVGPSGEDDLRVRVSPPDASHNAGDLGDLVGVVDNNGQVTAVREQLKVSRGDLRVARQDADLRDGRRRIRDGLEESRLADPAGTDQERDGRVRLIGDTDELTELDFPSRQVPVVVEDRAPAVIEVLIRPQPRPGRRDA